MGVRKELAPMIYITGNSTSSEEIGTDVDYSYQPRKPHELMDVILNHYMISAGNFPSVRHSRNWWVRWCCEVTHLENPQQVLFPYMRYIAAGGARIKNLPVLLTLPFFESCTVTSYRAMRVGWEREGSLATLEDNLALPPNVKPGLLYV